MSKANFDLKRLKITDATKAWLRAELVKQPGKKAQEIVRERLHAMALNEIRSATVLSGMAAELGILGDGGGQT